MRRYNGIKSPVGFFIWGHLLVVGSIIGIILGGLLLGVFTVPAAGIALLIATVSYGFGAVIRAMTDYKDPIYETNFGYLMRGAPVEKTEPAKAETPYRW